MMKPVVHFANCLAAVILILLFGFFKRGEIGGRKSTAPRRHIQSKSDTSRHSVVRTNNPHAYSTLELGATACKRFLPAAPRQPLTERRAAPSGRRERGHIGVLQLQKYSVDRIRLAFPLDAPFPYFRFWHKAGRAGHRPTGPLTGVVRPTECRRIIARSTVGDRRDGLRRTRAPNRRTEICRNDTPRSQRAQPVKGVERELLQADGESSSSDIVTLATFLLCRETA
jgi:hypothetical protein